MTHQSRVEDIRAWCAEQHTDDGEEEPPELLEDVFCLLDALPVYRRQPRPADASDIAEAQRQTDEFDHEMTPLSEILARMN